MFKKIINTAKNLNNYINNLKRTVSTWDQNHQATQKINHIIKETGVFIKYIVTPIENNRNVKSQQLDSINEENGTMIEKYNNKTNYSAENPDNVVKSYRNNASINSDLTDSSIGKVKAKNTMFYRDFSLNNNLSNVERLYDIKALSQGFKIIHDITKEDWESMLLDKRKDLVDYVEENIQNILLYTTSLTMNKLGGLNSKLQLNQNMITVCKNDRDLIKILNALSEGAYISINIAKKNAQPEQFVVMRNGGGNYTCVSDSKMLHNVIIEDIIALIGRNKEYRVVYLDKFLQKDQQGNKLLKDYKEINKGLIDSINR